MSDTVNTTSPVDPGERVSCTSAAQGLVPAFVICHCAPEPHRVGEVMLFDPRARRAFVIGRLGVHSFRQRPGEMIDCGRLKGEAISGERAACGPEGID